VRFTNSVVPYTINKYIHFAILNAIKILWHICLNKNCGVTTASRYWAVARIQQRNDVSCDIRPEILKAGPVRIRMLLSRVGGFCAWLIDGFCIGCLDFLTLYRFNSGLRAIQQYR
jgi:hypothetical protein